MKNRLETIKQIQGLIGIPTEYLDKILWTQEEGYNPNYWLRFICDGKKSALYLEGEKWCANQPFELYFLDSAALESKNPEEEMHLIKKFDKDVDATEAKAWAENWLLKYLQQPDVYVEEMTYRDIFKRADSRAASAKILPIDVEIQGEIVPFKTEQAFEICKGLGLFAMGQSYFGFSNNYTKRDCNPDHSKRKEFLNKRREIVNSNMKSAMEMAAEALGFMQKKNIDDCMNEWLDYSYCSVGLCEVNDIAAKIIVRILNDKNELD